MSSGTFGRFPAELTLSLLRAYRSRIDALIPAAERFCAAIDTRTSAGQLDFLRQVESALPEQYLRIIHLPAPDDWFDDEADDELQTADLEAAGLISDDLDKARYRLEQEGDFGQEISDLLKEFDGYRLAFDPFGEQGPWAGTLGHDLAELYGQLRTYIPLVRSGHPPSIREGLWNIRHDFDYHTGKHLVEALRAIHCLLRWDRSSWDDDAWDAGMDAGMIERSEPQP